jgi:hypothetical protein
VEKFNSFVLLSVNPVKVSKLRAIEPVRTRPWPGSRGRDDPTLDQAGVVVLG